MTQEQRNYEFDWGTFDPIEYLGDNFERIDPWDAEFLHDLAVFYAKENPIGLFLEVGAASNMYPILAALPYADQIDVWEYGIKNVRYLEKQTEALDPSWRKWIDELVKEQPDVYRGVDWQQQLREKMKVIHGSIFDLPSGHYDNTSMHSVIESITDELPEFEKGLQRVVDAGKPKSTFAWSFMKNSSKYHVAGKTFPAVPIEEWDVVKIFGPSSISLHVEPTTDHIRPGSPLIKVTGRKK